MFQSIPVGPEERGHSYLVCHCECDREGLRLRRERFVYAAERLYCTLSTAVLLLGDRRSGVLHAAQPDGRGGEGEQSVN